MNVENKQKLIDAINAKEKPWTNWMWDDCFAGMVGKLIGKDKFNVGVSTVQYFLGITADQAHDMVYLSTGGQIENQRHSWMSFYAKPLAEQKKTLIDGINSITDDTSSPVWDLQKI